MDLFYKGHDPNARITSGAMHLSAAAARFAVSIVRSVPHLPVAAWEEFQRLLSVDTLWSLCLILAGWLIATVVGGVIGLAVNAVLIVYGLFDLWEQLKATGGSLRDWAVAAYEAQNDSELDTAAQHFAAAMSKGGITLLELIVTHRVFRAVEGKLRERFPTPDWLEQQYKQAAKEREANTQRANARRLEQAKDAALRAAEVTASGARGEGAKRAAEDFPTGAVVFTGAVLAVGTVLVATWAASMSSRAVPR